jgi:hypothetical protein
MDVIIMKKFIIGVLFGVILSTSMSVYGEEVKSVVGQAIQGTFPVKVNGDILNNEAVVLDGTSYLPVREISEKLGMEVKFTPDTGIELTRPEPKLDNTGMPIGYWTKERLDIAIESQKKVLISRENMARISGVPDPEGIAKAKDRLAELEKMRDELLK